MNKNLNLLYFSPTDGTKKIITTIAKNINANYKEFDITLPEKRVEEIHFDENDLVIIAVPTYAGRFPKILNTYLDKIKCSRSLAVFVVTYGNRDYEDSLLELKDTFENKEFIGLAAATFITEHSSTEKLATGRPNMDDLKIASDFGLQIKNRLENLNNIDEILSLKVPGQFPYVVKNMAMPPMTPETNDTCVTCGICAKNCPTAAINFEDCKTINPNKCIKCRSCVKKCPFDSKAFTQESYKNMQNILEANFAHIARVPEIFIG